MTSAVALWASVIGLAVLVLAAGRPAVRGRHAAIDELARRARRGRR